MNVVTVNGHRDAPCVHSWCRLDAGFMLSKIEKDKTASCLCRPAASKIYTVLFRENWKKAGAADAADP